MSELLGQVTDKLSQASSTLSLNKKRDFGIFSIKIIDQATENPYAHGPLQSFTDTMHYVYSVYHGDSENRRRKRRKDPVEQLSFTDERPVDAVNLGILLHNIVPWLTDEDLLGTLGVNVSDMGKSSDTLSSFLSSDLLVKQVGTLKDGLNLVRLISILKEQGAYQEKIIDPLLLYQSRTASLAAPLVLASEMEYMVRVGSREGSYKIGEGKPRKYVQLVGRFDQIRSGEIWEFKYGLPKPIPEYALQLGMHSLAYQAYSFNDAYEARVPRLDVVQKAKLLAHPDLILYDFYNGKIFSLEFDDYPQALRRLINMLFFAHIARQGNYYGQENRLAAFGKQADEAMRMTSQYWKKITIVDKQYSAKDCFDFARYFQRKYLETAHWLEIKEGSLSQAEKAGDAAVLRSQTAKSKRQSQEEKPVTLSSEPGPLCWDCFETIMIWDGKTKSYRCPHCG